MILIGVFMKNNLFLLFIVMCGSVYSMDRSLVPAPASSNEIVRDQVSIPVVSKLAPEKNVTFSSGQEFFNPVLDYAKYNHVIFPDEIIDLITKEKKLYDLCCDQKLYAQSKKNYTPDREQLISYANVYARKKKMMSEENWKTELVDFAKELNRSIVEHTRRLEIRAEGFVEVNPSAIALAKCWEREQRALIVAQNRVPFAKRMFWYYVPRNVQNVVQTTVDDVQKVVREQCTLCNAQTLVRQGLDSIGYGMRVACHVWHQAQNALEEAKRAADQEQ